MIYTLIKYYLVSLVVLFSGSSLYAQLVKVNEIDNVYRAPESVVYDSVRNLLYISNFTNPVKEGQAYGEHAISKASADGTLLEKNWITGLTSPTGICIHQDSLYIVERFGVVVYDLDSDQIATKHFVNTTHFLNDITVDKANNIYVSVSDLNCIYQISDNQVEVWLDDTLIANPNGLLALNDYLLVGSIRHSNLSKVDFETKKISPFAAFPSGTVDGIKEYSGGYLVSIFEGELYSVDKSGEIKLLMDTKKQGLYLADFEYVGSRQLLIIPALWNNKLLFYKYLNR